MANIIAGFDTGLLDSSLNLLKRDDQTGAPSHDHGNQFYVNVANGNLIVQQQDAYLPSLGEDYALLRTYNSGASPTTPISSMPAGA